MTTANDEIPTFDITVKKDSLEEDMFAIYSQLFKDETITKDQLSFEELCGGFINAIYKVSLKKDKSKSFVFRTYGSWKFDRDELAKKMEGLSEEGKLSEDANQEREEFTESCRQSELAIMRELSKHGLCQPVYGKYENGIIYGYTEGVTLTGELMNSEDFLHEGAKKLARLHSIKYEVPGIKFKTNLERQELQFRPPFKALIKKAYAKLEQQGLPYPYSEMPSIQDQFEFEEKILSFLEEVGLGRVVLCHNDCNQKNLLWNAETKSLAFIDFEMTMANYQPFELGLLISCFSGHFFYNYDSKLFPNEDYCRRFLRTYLEEFYKLNGLDAGSEEFETELEDLFHKVNLTALLNIIDWVEHGCFFDINPELFQNPDIAEERAKDKFYCGKFSLKCYRHFQELYEPFFEDAKRHFAKRKQASSYGHLGTGWQ